MRKLKRKGQSLFALVLAVLLAASSFLYTGDLQVKAADSDFEITDGKVTGYDGTDTNVVIPDGVTEIDTASFVGSDIESVTIPGSVKKLNQNAFMYCENLENVTFEGKVETVEAEPFNCCAELITFYCQKQYESYYEDLKYDLTDQGAVIDASLPNSGGTEQPDPNPGETKNEAFTTADVDGGCAVTAYDVAKGGQDVVVPAEIGGKKVVAIADDAFNQNVANVGYAKWIRSVKLPDTIKTIGVRAFYGCSRVSAIEIPEGVTTIGEQAFRYCNSLTEINIPASVTSIGDIAFKQAGGAHLKAINVAEGNTAYKSVDGVLLSADGKTLICYPTGKVGAPYEMPDTVETIANDAFRGDPAGLFDGSTQDGTHKLIKIILSKNLKEIGDRAFEQTGLTSITITSDIKVGEYAFAGCKNLETVVFGEGVTEIPDYAFMNMENVVSVKLPSTLKKIGYRAFDRYGASSIDLPEGLEVISEEAFANAELTSVKIPSTVTTVGPRAFYSANKLKNVTFAGGSKIETIGEYAFNHCTALASVSLPNSLKKLENGCFSSCPALTGIAVPSSVTEFGDFVFAGSGLTEITLPDSIQKMGMATFRSCTKLTSVKMPKNLSSLGTCTFEDCSVLTKADFPDGIKLSYVPEDTFFNCKAIENIYLPAAIAETRACSFSNCDKNPTIEYANANLKRNIFDCYAIDPGSAYRLADDGFYYTTEEINDSSFSDDAYQEKVVGKDNNVTASYADSTVHGRSAGSVAATCGCGSNLGANVKLTPSSNPKFVYKKASSGINAGGGSNGGSNGAANGGQNGGNGTGKTTGKKSTSPKVTGTVARTGDNSFAGGYIALLVLALGSVVAVVVYKKRTMGQR